MPLTDTQIEEHCRTHLVPLTRYVASKLGDEASTYTGECLLRALRAYDETRGNIGPYLRVKTYNLVMDVLRSMHGRRGSKKYEAQASHVSVEDFDLPAGQAPDESAESDEAFNIMVKTLERASGVRRAILLGRSGGMSNEYIQGTLDVSQETMRIEGLAISELAQAA